MASLMQYPHITSNPAILAGEPIVEGTRTSVRAIVEMWRSGVSAEEIPVHLPHLKLSQVFAALGYYSDFPDEIELHIRANHPTSDFKST